MTSASRLLNVGYEDADGESQGVEFVLDGGSLLGAHPDVHAGVRSGGLAPEVQLHGRNGGKIISIG
jgi:hypothetical protein